MNHRHVYDLIGVGIGPFNLGLAALCAEVPQLSCLFFDGAEGFDWHPGMMLPEARMQVPFYADLVTPVNPCNRYSYLNYLREEQRLFRFAIHEHHFITRKEYNRYCQWVTKGLDTLRFQHRVEDVVYDPMTRLYTVLVHHTGAQTLTCYRTKRIVLGVGTVPSLPDCARFVDHPMLFHSGQYLPKKEALLQQSSITIVGSGQSAAEIFYDLLPYSEQLEHLSWFTRSERWYPMEYSKLTLEMTSPDYVDHFYSVPMDKKQDVLRKQAALYKGINFDLINAIYDALYLKELDGVHGNIYLHPNCALQTIEAKEEGLTLLFQHQELDEPVAQHTGAAVLATGYKAQVPAFLDSISDRICWDNNQQYAVHRNYAIDVHGSEVFVQNAELHTHGFTAPDLGMGPYRNAVILNTVLGYEHFRLEQGVAFQTFGSKKK